MKNVISLISCLLLGLTTASAQSGAVVKGKKYMRVITAVSQRTIPGIQQVHPFVNYKFIVVWHSKKIPDAFIWENGSIAICNIDRLHRKGNVPLDLADASTFNTISVLSANKIISGDTLLLTASRTTEDLILPRKLQKHTKTIIVKLKTGTFLYMPVKGIKSLPDIIMP